MAIGKEGNVKWVDGLRGLASSLVVATHVARGFDELLFDPAEADGGNIRFLQLPFFRIFTQGRLGVAIFSMVTGYVCALKPIKLSGQGNQEAALKSMAKSALRRTPRLVMPATIATLLIWFAAQFGIFSVAKHCPGWWTSGSSPNMFPTIGESLSHLVHNLISTWARHINAYDPNQWTLQPLLTGSMKIYVFVTATCYLEPRYRMMAALVMYAYYGAANDPYFGMQFFWGAFLAELQNHTPATEFFASRFRLSRVLAVICLLLGLAFASLPERHHDWVAWSRIMKATMRHVLPENPEYGKWGTGIGLEFLTLAIYFSPLARNVLSNRFFLWLGRQSFAVYLLHGPMIRTVLCWMLFGFTVPDNTVGADGQVQIATYPPPTGLQLSLCVIVWLPMVYAVATAWTLFVDPWCAKVTEKMVTYTKAETDEKPLLPTR